MTKTGKFLMKPGAIHPVIARFLIPMFVNAQWEVITVIIIDFFCSFIIFSNFFLGDKNSDLRFWGNAIGRKEYNPKTGLIESRDRIPWYNLWDMNSKLNRLSLKKYEEKYRDGSLPCHSKS